MSSKLYHKDVGFPADMELPATGLELLYSAHALREALHDQWLSLPKALTAYDLIEAQVQGYSTLKWVVRVATGTSRDLVLVVQPDGLVRTCWTNHQADLHTTLRRHLYAVPEQS